LHVQASKSDGRTNYHQEIATMLILEQRAAGVTVPSKTMEGFSLYENTMHKLRLQYPSTWNKQEIILKDDHMGLDVMFVVPIGTCFSKTEDSKSISDKIRYVIYKQSSAKVVLSLKRLPVHETYTLQDITNDHIHALGICFDNVNLLETFYDYNIGKMSASKLFYTYLDPLQNHLHKEGLKIIWIKEHKEISVTYSSQTQDFDSFLPTIGRMVDTLSVEG
jgi:hypothetical protein